MLTSNFAELKALLGDEKQNICRMDQLYAGAWHVNRMLDEMKRLGISGVSLALVEGRKLAWAETKGVRKAGIPDPVTPETLSRRPPSASRYQSSPRSAWCRKGASPLMKIFARTSTPGSPASPCASCSPTPPVSTLTAPPAIRPEARFPPSSNPSMVRRMQVRPVAAELELLPEGQSPCKPSAWTNISFICARSTPACASKWQMGAAPA